MEKNNTTLDSTIPVRENTYSKAPTLVQMHLSESGKAFQAVSQSFSVLQPGVAMIPPQ